MQESASLTLGSGTPQQRALFEPCSAQIPHVASPQSRRLPTRGLRASQRQQNTTFLVCVRTLTPVRAGATPSARHGSCRGSGIIRARITTRTSRWTVPTMKTTMEEAGRRRGARCQKQTATDSNNSCRHRHRMIAYRGGDWQDSWRRGQQRPAKTMPPPLPLPPSSSMSFPDAIKKAKVAATTAEAETVRDSGGQ